jgi:hypothetical protein
MQPPGPVRRFERQILEIVVLHCAIPTECVNRRSPWPPFVTKYITKATMSIVDGPFTEYRIVDGD